MALSVGIMGLPNVGKSTLFNSLTQAGAEVSNYPFCTIDRNVGITPVPDERLEAIDELLHPKECLSATVQFVDIAGLVQGASQGEGLGNKFLGHIREVDALVHVLRCFDDERISHVAGEVDPIRDAEIVQAELCLADLEAAEKSLDGARKHAKADPKKYADRISDLGKIVERLAKGELLNDISAMEAGLLKEIPFLTAKPVLYVANISEADIGVDTRYTKQVRERFGAENVVDISVKIESELLDLSESEREDFLEEMGLSEPSLNRLIVSAYRLLNYETFYTIAHEKLRAWQVVRGTTAVEAAGRIHSDMAAGFIKAQVTHYEDLMHYKSLAEASHHGHLRAEGRDYVIQDGDVIEFAFH